MHLSFSWDFLSDFLFLWDFSVDKLACRLQIDCAMSSSSSIVPPASSSSTPYGPTSTDSVHRKVLRQSVAAICKTAAFESIEGHALELLTHMLASCESIGKIA